MPAARDIAGASLPQGGLAKRLRRYPPIPSPTRAGRPAAHPSCHSTRACGSVPPRPFAHGRMRCPSRRASGAYRRDRGRSYDLAVGLETAERWLPLRPASWQGNL